MAAARYLIVNADDFGLSPGVNRGIIEAHEHGVVTSASLMVRQPGAAEAAAYGREHSGLSLGLHVDLCEWVYHDGAWAPVYEVVPPDDSTAVADEILRQVAAFRDFVGRDPTHLDSHQHVHREEPARSVMVEVARELGVPLRHYSADVHYCGDFYGQTAEGLPLPGAISVDGLIAILAALPPGLTELCCHPGAADDLDTAYRTERAEEVKVLCDPQIRVALGAMDIQLRSFGSTVRRQSGSKP